MTLNELVMGIYFNVDEASIMRAQARVDAFGQRLTRLGSQLSMFISLPIAAATTYALKAAANLEMVQTSFDVFIGNTEKAKQVMSELIDFAVKTPFRFEGLTKTANMLLAMGEGADSLIGTMRILGDVSRGDQELLNRVALAYGQIMTAGKLRGQELRQLTEAGVGILPELSKLTGYSTQDLVSNVSKKNISAATVRQALVNMTSEGGHYFQLLEKQAKTIAGVFSNLQDSIYFFAGSFGKSIVELMNLNSIVTRITESLNKITQMFDKFSDSQKKLIFGLTFLAAAIGPIMLFVSMLIRSGSFVISTLQMMTMAIGGLNAGMGAFMLRVIAIPALIVAAVAAIVILIDEVQTWMNGGESYLGDLFGPYTNIKPQVDKFFSDVQTGFVAVYNYIKDNIIPMINDVALVIKGFANGDALDVANGGQNLALRIWKVFSDLVNGFFIKGSEVIMFLLKMLKIVLVDGFLVGGSNLINTFFAAIMFEIQRIINWVTDKIMFWTNGFGKGKVFGKDKTDISPSDRLALRLQQLAASIDSTAISKLSSSDFMTNSNGYGNNFLTNLGKGLDSAAINTLTNNISVTVPPGTSTDQVEFLKQTAKKVFEIEFTKQTNFVLASSGNK
jgi:tape measure domain-containing protein